MIYDIFLNTAIEYSIAAGFRQSGPAVLFCRQWLLPDIFHAISMGPATNDYEIAASGSLGAVFHCERIATGHDCSKAR
jgi:hypothetical protein